MRLPTSFLPSSTKLTITLFASIFDEASSCSRRSQDLLDRITDTAATLESMCKPDRQDAQLTDFSHKGPAFDPDALLQGMRFLYQNSHIISSLPRTKTQR